MNATLSPVMTEALKYWALVEMNGVDAHRVSSGGNVNTRVALIRRNLLTPGYKHELTDIGRDKGAELLPEYAAWLERVTQRTTKCSNRWHASSPAFARMLCPECPADEQQSEPTTAPDPVSTAVAYLREMGDPKTTRARFHYLVSALTELAATMNEYQREEVVASAYVERLAWPSRTQ